MPTTTRDFYLVDAIVVELEELDSTVDEDRLVAIIVEEVEVTVGVEDSVEVLNFDEELDDLVVVELLKNNL